MLIFVINGTWFVAFITKILSLYKIVTFRKEHTKFVSY
jgi:hypothetical protein